ncbi:MarR family transcriptional regulator [Maritimibacter sp. UBA3975]|uniref:MarR family winged helix-turn-helix transcriptional regulator n=1 Tax=Maritimibacter sp. UBA3975 TaxID=1946833 RepID=UPI000C0B7004|nr:MarR family transcriptional regulator [Maritimibacter sp. UBA3975]MAM63523.1 MarR family transcriptional regulator [Maritimibacter sp.]|tara:strand:+ start:84788 stop:85261 length:474 start_codon:yes stop_codon:yes gene_type:complete
MADSALQEQDEAPIRMGDITDSLGFLIRIAQIKAFDNFFANLGEHGLKPGEFTVLWVIGLNPGLRQGTIANTLRIKPAHMTKLTGRLVEKGFVARATAATDRRAVRLSLTPAGLEFVDAHKDSFLSFNFAEKDNLSDDEAAKLIALLKKFTGLNTCH